ncbi:MAG: DUF1559 domain-containing protein [Planctomycetaceae bacterium]
MDSAVASGCTPVPDRGSCDSPAQLGELDLAGTGGGEPQEPDRLQRIGCWLRQPPRGPRGAPFYRCPSFSGQDMTAEAMYTNAGNFGTDRFAIRNYAAMGAISVVGLSGGAPAEGVMFPGSRVRMADITDGTSNTILVAETRDQNSAVWIDGSSASLAARWVDPAGVNPPFGGSTVSINHSPHFGGGVLMNPLHQQWGPSSLHPGGAQHALGDGQVRLISENLNVGTYDALVGRNDGQVVGAY